MKKLFPIQIKTSDNLKDQFSRTSTDVYALVDLIDQNHNRVFEVKVWYSKKKDMWNSITITSSDDLLKFIDEALDEETLKGLFKLGFVDERYIKE